MEYEDLTQLPIYEKGLEKLIAKCRGKIFISQMI